MFEAKCECGWETQTTSKPGRETQCRECKSWVAWSPNEWWGKAEYTDPNPDLVAPLMEDRKRLEALFKIIEEDDYLAVVGAQVSLERKENESNRDFLDRIIKAY